MSETPACRQVQEDLAALMEDTLSPALREHVASCDSCRDLRHELRALRNEIALAGSDYQHPEDFEAKLLGVLSSRENAGAATPSLNNGGDKSITQKDASAAAPVAGAAKNNENAAAKPRKAVPWIPLAFMGAIAAAAALPLVLRSVRSTGEDPPSHAPNVPVVPVANNGSWSGRVALVARASADRAGGVEFKAPGASAFQPAAEGAVLVAGSEVRTDPRTRARIELADGTRVVLDRSTHLRLDTGAARAATLVSGALVADVAHLTQAPPARLSLPQGGVTVLGTKLALTATDDRSTVRVTRGAVRVGGGTGSEVEVKTGQEGVLSRGEAPRIAPAVDLASSVAWSELNNNTRIEEDAPVVGLGELRARRPGQTQERDHAVRLVSHSVRVRIVGNQARTEIEETFRNEGTNELEGIYRFPLPPQAQIEKLALDVRGEMEPGAFVDRQRAAAIWRGVLRNAVAPMQQRIETQELVWVPGPWHDPALLEWQRGGRFELRVFPIPAHGQRRVAIAYTQTIEPSGGVRRYVYPLAHDANGSTTVEQFDVDVQVLGHDANAGVRARGYALTPDTDAPAPSGATRMSFSQSNFVPAGDLVLEYAQNEQQAPLSAWAFRPSRPIATGGAAVPPSTTTNAPVPNSAPDERAFVALALRPQLPHWTETRPRDYALVVDASRSMVGERLARASRLVRAMISEMDPRDRVTVLACDVTCRTISGGLRFAGGEVAQAAETFLHAEEPHGGSDLVQAVRDASEALRGSADRDPRIVYVGDGAPTVGHRRPEAIAAEVAAVLPSGRATVTAVAVGSDADSTVLGALARAGGGVVVPYAPGETLAAAALGVLEATYGLTLRDPELVLPAGLMEVAPSRLPTLRAGSETIVVARMTGEEIRGEAVLRGTVAGERFETRIPLEVRVSRAAGNAFVPRLFAATRIAELEAQGGGREEIVALSQRFHVASRHTSLLVLESEAMYRAFGVERNRDGEAAWTGEEQAEATHATSTTPRPDPGARREHSAAMVPVLAQGVVVTATGQQPSTAEDLGSTVVGGMDALLGTGGAQERRADNAPAETAAGEGGLAAGGEQEPLADEEPATGTTALGGGARASAGAGFSTTRGGPMARPTVSATPSAPAATQAAPTPAQAPARSRAAGRTADFGRAPGLGNDFDPSDRGSGQWMRRVWVRRASVSEERAANSSELSRVATARAALQAMPDSRTRHQELYRWLAVTGNVEEAGEVAERWARRDALDPDALLRLSEVAARRGQRDRSVRILSGIVDVRSEDAAGVRKLAVLHERAGEDARACAYRVSLAELLPNDVQAQADAQRCERGLGHSASADRLRSSMRDPSLQTRVDALLGQAPPVAPVRGDLQLSATWDRTVDLDVAVVDPRGNRISWMGGRTTGLTVRGARELSGEGLGVSRLSAGEYFIEVSRAANDNGGTASSLVRGSMEITALGQRRSVRFELGSADNTVRVGRVVITREQQLVPL